MLLQNLSVRDAQLPAMRSGFLSLLPPARPPASPLSSHSTGLISPLLSRLCGVSLSAPPGPELWCPLP